LLTVGKKRGFCLPSFSPRKRDENGGPVHGPRAFETHAGTQVPAFLIVVGKKRGFCLPSFSPRKRDENGGPVHGPRRGMNRVRGSIETGTKRKPLKAPHVGAFFH
jgi:hypothetical protein